MAKVVVGVVALGMAPDPATVPGLVMVKEVDQGPMVEGMEAAAAGEVEVEEDKE